MTTTTTTTRTARNTRDLATTAAQYARQSKDLLIAVMVYAKKTMPDGRAKLSERALRSVGKRMLKKDNALPQEPSELRQHAETWLQRTRKLITELQSEGDLGTLCTYSTIKHDADEAIANLQEFIAIYSATRDFIKEQANA